VHCVQETMLSGGNAALRASCASLLLKFLLDWPLSERRLTQHFSFIICSLSYAEDAGRLQALEFLHNVVNKFPPALLSTKASFLLVPLAARLSGEGDAACRRLLADVACALISRVDAQRREEVASWCTKWLQAHDTRLSCVALQLLGFQVVAEGGKGGKRVAAVLVPLVEILEAHACASSAGDGADGLEWREAYFGLLLLERVGVQGLVGAVSKEGLRLRIWAVVSRLLRHQHLWVQKVAARVAGGALACSAATAELMSLPEAAGQLALSLYLQVADPSADDAMRLQAAKCLVATVPHLPMRPSGHLPMPPSGSGTDADSFDSGSENNGSPLSRHPTTRLPAITLFGLCKRMAAVASDRRPTMAQPRLAALQWLGAVGHALGGEALRLEDSALLRLLVLPLYRVQEGSGEDPEEVCFRIWCLAGVGILDFRSFLIIGVSCKVPQPCQWLCDFVSTGLKTLSIGSV
jgi:hypothetical protein